MWEAKGQGAQMEEEMTAVSGCGYLRDWVHGEGIGGRQRSQGTQRGDRGQTEVSGCGYLRDRVHREGIGADRGLRVHREGIGGRQRSQGVGTSGTGYTERG